MSQQAAGMLAEAPRTPAAGGGGGAAAAAFVPPKPESKGGGSIFKRLWKKCACCVLGMLQCWALAA